jgi:hypothetical protein
MAQPLFITLTAPPAIEESLVDWLLQFESHAGFTSHRVNGHSSNVEGLNLAEQVAGRKNQVQFQLHIPGEELPRFMEALTKDFSGVGIHYWVSPLIGAGHI